LDFLSFVEAVHPCAFDGADVHEDILAAIVWLDEAKALLAVKPLYDSLRHIELLSIRVLFGRAIATVDRSIEIWREVVSPTHSARRGQVVRPKLDALDIVHRRGFHKGYDPGQEKAGYLSA
jgi:hypothetical protein